MWRSRGKAVTVARTGTSSRWAQPAPKMGFGPDTGVGPKTGFGPRLLVLVCTIVVNSAADSVDRMLLTEVVDSLTMVPPAVDAPGGSPCLPKQGPPKELRRRD